MLLEFVTYVTVVITTMSLLLAFEWNANQNYEIPDKRLFPLTGSAVPNEVIEGVGAQFINGGIESPAPIDL